MATQKYMGKNKLVKRLAAQTGDEGMAIALLKKRGHMNKKGKLTTQGKKRDNMTAEQRAKDRAAKDAGGTPAQFKYNPNTNQATKRKK